MSARIFSANLAVSFWLRFDLFKNTAPPLFALWLRLDSRFLRGRFVDSPATPIVRFAAFTGCYCCLMIFLEIGSSER